jgi:hypothetical protein
VESGPTTPLPDKKLLVFILDRLQKCVCFLTSKVLFLIFLLVLIGFLPTRLQKGHSWSILGACGSGRGAFF